MLYRYIHSVPGRLVTDDSVARHFHAFYYAVGAYVDRHFDSMTTLFAKMTGAFRVEDNCEFNFRNHITASWLSLML